jgi:hypothetical protein
VRKREWLWISLFLLLAYGWAGKNDIEEQERIERVKQDIRPVLSHPIGYAATVSICAAGKCDHRYYFTKERR